MPKSSDRQKKIEDVIAKVRSDKAFRKRLLEAPGATLKTEGFAIRELRDEDLERVSGGSFDDFSVDQILQDEIRKLQDDLDRLEEAIRRIMDNAIFADVDYTPRWDE